MKTIATLCATSCAVIVQTCALGLNGLTLVTIPLTLYLGLEIANKVMTKKESINH